MNIDTDEYYGEDDQAVTEMHEAWEYMETADHEVVKQLVLPQVQWEQHADDCECDSCLNHQEDYMLELHKTERW